MIHQEEHYDNTNSVIYIIENNDNEPHQTRILDDIDIVQFVKYGTLEEFRILSSDVKKRIFALCFKNYFKTNSDIFKICVDAGRYVGYSDACAFAEMNLDVHLTIILSKLNLTQDQYADLFFRCIHQKSMNIVASYLNQEGFEYVKIRLNKNIVDATIKYVAALLFFSFLFAATLVHGYMYVCIVTIFSMIIFCTYHYNYNICKIIRMNNTIKYISDVQSGFFNV